MKKKIIGLLLLMAIIVMAVGCSTPKEETKETTVTEETTTEKVTADAVDQKKVYVSPQWVQSVIDGNQEESKDYIILNVAWGTEEDNPAYSEGHIKGAVHMNTDNVEEEKLWNIRTPEELEKLCADFGITKDTTVIVYSDKPENSADDRVAYALLYLGVDNVKSLDGGLAAWEKAGYGLEKGSNKPEPTTKGFGVKVPARPEFIISIDEVKEKLANDDNFKLVSNRSWDEFIGKTSGYSYIDRAGEPKGAIWGHDTDDLSYATEEGTTVGIDVSEKYLKEAGASFDNEIAYYCGTGWRSCIPFLIAYEDGKENVRMYDGGWFQWQMDPANEVQVGDPNSADVKYTTVGELSTDMAPKQ